jgi:hypothetical protein
VRGKKSPSGKAISSSFVCSLWFYSSPEGGDIEEKGLPLKVPLKGRICQMYGRLSNLFIAIDTAIPYE